MTMADMEPQVMMTLLCGVFNSNGRSKEREQDGFQGTIYTKNDASYGVWLFLNICASYLPKRKMRGWKAIRQLSL